MRHAAPLVLLAACSRYTLHIHYDPLQLSWAALAGDDWPSGEDFARDHQACTDGIDELVFGSTMTFDGTWPEWKGALSEGTLQIADVEVPVTYEHSIGAGAEARPTDDAFTFPDGSAMLWTEFYGDQHARLGTEAPGRNYCWHWFEAK